MSNADEPTVEWLVATVAISDSRQRSLACASADCASSGTSGMTRTRVRQAECDLVVEVLERCCWHWWLLTGFVFLRTWCTEDIVNSLKPGAEEPLTVKPDGTIMDGNHRIRILRDRGYPVDSLPRVPHGQ